MCCNTIIPTYLCPAFSEGVPVSVHNIEQDNSSKLPAEVRAKFDGDSRNSDGLILHSHHRIVWNTGGKLLRQQTCGLRQRDHDVIENIGEDKMPSKRRTLPETGDRPFNDVIILKGGESVCNSRNHRLPNNLKHLLVKDRSVA